jgi:hypothetical protein
MRLWKRKPDLLVEETLAFVQEASVEPNRSEKPILAAELVESVLQSNLPKPKDRLFKDEELQNRLSSSKQSSIDLSVNEKNCSGKQCRIFARLYLRMTFDHRTYR